MGEGPSREVALTSHRVQLHLLGSVLVRGTLQEMAQNGYRQLNSGSAVVGCQSVYQQNVFEAFGGRHAPS